MTKSTSTLLEASWTKRSVLFAWTAPTPTRPAVSRPPCPAATRTAAVSVPSSVGEYFTVQLTLVPGCRVVGSDGPPESENSLDVWASSFTLPSEIGVEQLLYAVSVRVRGPQES